MKLERVGPRVRFIAHCSSSSWRCSEHIDAPKRQIAMLDAVVAALRRSPAWRSVAGRCGTVHPAGGIFGQLTAEGQSRRERRRIPTLILEVVGDRLLLDVRHPVLRGRGFTAADRKVRLPS